MTFSMTWVRSWRDLPEPLGFDDRIEARAGGYYDRATAGIRGGRAGADATASAGAGTSGITSASAAEADDGLTPEQRKMLDDLGKS